VAVVALASVKGAPGVTTTVLALGSAWPAHRAVIVMECDPAGGDISARRGLAAEPNLVSLAAAVRRSRGHSATNLADHCQQLPGGLRIVAGSPAPTEMRSAIAAVGRTLPELAADAAADLLVDCGRLDSGVAGSAEHGDAAGAQAARPLPLIQGSDFLVLVSRGDLADLSHLESWLPVLRSLTESMALVLVGNLSWHVEEVSAALDVEVIGQVPHDPTGAAAVNGGPLRGAWARLPVLRAARAAADRIAEKLPAAQPERRAEAHAMTPELNAVPATAEASS
jgi:MinD-like ATPase involved in chromosome partitioning or flagellar assembly